MSNTTPYSLGRAAFERGATCVPCHDPALMEHLRGTPGEAIAVLDEWLRGWHEANVAAPVCCGE